MNLPSDVIPGGSVHRLSENSFLLLIYISSNSNKILPD
ncbi:hypothetical protein SB48_HM08orf04642 [Heyndrickxia coagulans]|uniref:Uncharacterized protein n=1 Tax=Heyndrickxia coagulans TaxID=1398 RepID=A0AAN0T6F2_HEYCO|nr:hypothetical protein SB48_HM08orf04642 [Heyndrickxia coagulans]